MTEHSAVIFVFFFLAEYASIVLMCVLISILFLGGYNINSTLISYVLDIINLNCIDILSIVKEAMLNVYNSIISWWEFTHLNYIFYTKFNVYLADSQTSIEVNNTESLGLSEFLTNPNRENFVYAFVIGFKTFIMIFVFIWVRASFPRIRFDQLMSYCWTVLLPLIFAFIILVPCILYSFEIIPVNVLFF